MCPNFEINNIHTYMRDQLKKIQIKSIIFRSEWMLKNLLKNNVVVMNGIISYCEIKWDPNWSANVFILSVMPLKIVITTKHINCLNLLSSIAHHIEIFLNFWCASPKRDYKKKWMMDRFKLDVNFSAILWNILNNLFLNLICRITIFTIYFFS